MKSPALPAPGRPTTRPPLDRMMRIFQEVNSGSYPNREFLAAQIEVTVKTIQRDIDFLRDRLALPIAYNRDRRGYHFTEPVHSFPLVELTEAEIVSVFIAQKALAAQRGTIFEKPLQSAYAKLISSVNGRISVPWAELASGVSFTGFDASPAELATFEAVSDAVRHCRVLQFSYRGLSDRKPTRRTAHPHHLACVQGQWYAISWDQRRKDWRSFVLTRMTDVTVTEERFTRDAAFQINTYLKSSLGIFRGKGAHHVVLRFDEWSARRVRERSWHPCQQIHELIDGGVELHLDLSSFEEIIPWILSWSTHVTVVEPRELRESLRETLTEMTKSLRAIRAFA